MLDYRVIPILLLKDRGLYKGIKFKNHKYVGDPLNTIKIFNEKGVDELVVYDINATINQHIDFDYLEQISSEAFIPLAYGGGINTLDQIDRLFKIGFEKVIINSNLSNGYDLLKCASIKYGNQSIVAAIDIKKSFINNEYQVFTHCGKRRLRSVSIHNHIQNIISNGCGEIILNSIDRDGTLSGYEIPLLEYLRDYITIPIVFAGGARNISDLITAIEGGASAAAAGAMFVYNGPHKAVMINYPDYKELTRNIGGKQHD